MVVEDEYHFLAECPTYEDLRSAKFPRLFQQGLPLPERVDEWMRAFTNPRDRTSGTPAHYPPYRSDTEFWEDLSKFLAAAFIKLRRSISEALAKAEATAAAAVAWDGGWPGD